MSRFLIRGVVAALAIGIGMPIFAVETPATATDSRPWYKKLFVSAPKPVGPAVRSGPVTASATRPPTMSKPLTLEVVQASVKAESEALLRRMEVCDKLREIALDKNDEALMRQVDELERQAKAVYQHRVAALGVSKSAKAPLPTTAGASNVSPSPDLAPEKPLDPKTAAAKLVAPAAPVPVTGSAEVIRTVPGG